MGVSDAGAGADDRFDASAFRSLVESRRYTFWNVVGFAVIVGMSVYLFGYALALDGGFEYGYLRSVSVTLALIGSVGGMVLLWLGAKYHLRVWEDVRRCFAVSDEAYDDLVEPVLTRAYDWRRFVVEYLLALVAVVVVNWGLRIPIPWALTVDPEYVPWPMPSAEHEYVSWLIAGPDSVPCLLFGPYPCLDYLSAINYLYGSVVLFVIVAGFHGVSHFLSLATRVTEFPLRNVDTAAERLEPIARFSIFVSTSLFAGVILLLVVYAQLLDLAREVEAVDIDFVVEFSLVVILGIAGLILVGVLVFWLPQMAIHARLTEAKQDRLSAINDEYVALSEQARMESESVDYIATELEILDARRRNIKDVETWSYNLPSLVPFVGSGIASAVLLIAEVANLLR
jgi:hypothetical protein